MNICKFVAYEPSARLRSSHSIFFQQVTSSYSKDRPLTIIVSWLMSKENHVEKFVKLHTDNGVDVLKVNVTVNDVLKPTEGSQVCLPSYIDLIPIFNLDVTLNQVAFFIYIY